MALELFTLTKTIQRTDREGDKEVTYLAGVFTRPQLEKQIGHGLSKAQLRKLRQEKQLMLEEGKSQVDYFEVALTDEIKAWNSTAFRDGILWERNRLWDLARFLADKTIEECAKANQTHDPTPILKEFSEMILDVDTSPYKFHQKGPKRGQPIKESKEAWERREKKAAEECKECVAKPPSTPQEIKDAAALTKVEGNVNADPLTSGSEVEGVQTVTNPARQLPPARHICTDCGQDLSYSRALDKYTCANTKCSRMGIYETIGQDGRSLCTVCNKPLTHAMIRGFRTKFCSNKECSRCVTQDIIEESFQRVADKDVKTGPICPACKKPVKTSWNKVTGWCAEPACPRNGVVYKVFEIDNTPPQGSLMPRCAGCDEPMKFTPNSRYYVCTRMECKKFDHLIPVDPK